MSAETLEMHNSMPILRSECVGPGIIIGAGLGQKGLGFSLCAVPSQLVGPRISELDWS
jgi:hypothetical protein